MGVLDDKQVPVQDRIIRAGTELIYLRGYGGASMRDIAALANMNQSSLYHYFPSKSSILIHIMTRTLRDLNFAVNQSIEYAEDPVARLSSAAKTHVIFHCTRAKQAAIVDRDLDVLPDRARNGIVRLRDEYESTWMSILREGKEAGEFEIEDLGLTRLALLTMCSQVDSWYDSLGRLPAPAIADTYVKLVLRIVGVDPIPSTPSAAL